MANNYKKPKMHRSSGSAIGKRRTKIVACDHCNFSEPYDAKRKPTPRKTGSECPRCLNPTVRVFDSKAEYTYAQELKLLESMGEVREIQYQVKYDLHAPDFEDGKHVKVCTFIADFTYEQLNPNSALPDDPVWDFVVCDVKGGNENKVVVTPEAKLKIDWFEIEYGVPVTIIGR